MKIKHLIISTITFNLIDYIQTLIGIIYYKNILFELHNIYSITVFKILITIIGIIAYKQIRKENKTINISLFIINIAYLILISYNLFLLLKYF